MAKRIVVTQENSTGRNVKFRVGVAELSRSKLVAEIESGLHKGYHVRTINGVKTPVSKVPMAAITAAIRATEDDFVA